MTLHNTCDDLRQAIMASVIGEADQAIGDEVRHHLDMCDACRHFRDALMEEERMLRSAFDTVAAEAEPIRDRLVERLCNQTPSAPESCHSIRWRLLGGYRTMKPFYKLLSAAASIAIVVAVIWGLHSGDGRGIVFADVVAPLRHIERVAFDVTVRTRNPGHSSAKNDSCIHGKRLVASGIVGGPETTVRRLSKARCGMLCDGPRSTKVRPEQMRSAGANRDARLSGLAPGCQGGTGYG